MSKFWFGVLVGAGATLGYLAYRDIKWWNQLGKKSASAKKTGAASKASATGNSDKPATQGATNVDLPNGIYEGIWTGYLVELTNGVSFQTAFALQCLRCENEVKVEVNDGIALVYLTK